ncbi:MAG: hypothetical protein HQL50_07170, partial [Magnetococcales bacterium]|nr:hypothetical protein [Magnetococcales bacterium]
MTTPSQGAASRETTPPVQTAPVTDRAKALSLVLELERLIRDAGDLDALGELIVQKSSTLLTYRQAVLCVRNRSGRLEPKRYSHVTTPDPHAPFVRWLQRVVRHLDETGQIDHITTLTATSLPDGLAADWETWLPSHMAVTPLPPPTAPPVDEPVSSHRAATPSPAVLLLFRATPWNEDERPIRHHLGEAFGHAWQRLLWQPKPSAHTRWSAPLIRMGRWRWLLVFLLVGVLVGVRIPLSVMANASVCA